MNNLKDINNIKSHKRIISLSPKNNDYKINRSFNSSPMNMKHFKINTPKMTMETYNSDREKVDKTSSTASNGKSFYSKLDVVKPFADLGIFLKMAILGLFFFVFVVSTHSK